MTRVTANHPDELNDAVIRAIAEKYLGTGAKLTTGMHGAFFQTRSNAKKIARELLRYHSDCHPYIQWNYLADCCLKLKKHDALRGMLLELFSSSFKQEISSASKLKHIIASHYVDAFRTLTNNSVAEHELKQNPELHAKQFYNQYRLEQGSVLARIK